MRAPAWGRKVPGALTAGRVLAHDREKSRRQRAPFPGTRLATPSWVSTCIPSSSRGVSASQCRATFEQSFRKISSKLHDNRAAGWPTAPVVSIGFGKCLGRSKAHSIYVAPMFVELPRAEVWISSA
jgi:hypothetical protein